MILANIVIRLISFQRLLSFSDLQRVLTLNIIYMILALLLVFTKAN